MLGPLMTEGVKARPTGNFQARAACETIVALTIARFVLTETVSAGCSHVLFYLDNARESSDFVHVFENLHRGLPADRLLIPLTLAKVFAMPRPYFGILGMSVPLPLVLPLAIILPAPLNGNRPAVREHDMKTVAIFSSFEHVIV